MQNVRSKANMSQLTYRTEPTTKKCRIEKLKSRKQICSEITVNSLGTEEKVGYGGKDLQKRKVLSLGWKSEGVMDDESGDKLWQT